MVVPPAGVWKASKGMVAFASIWCIFMTVFTCGWLLASNSKKSSGVPLPVWLIIGLFWLIGISMMAGAINMGRRRAVLRVDATGLKVAQQGPFGTRAWQWPREAIAAIRVDASGMEVNDRPVMELQIHPLSGRKKGFFMGRNEAELRWMAAELRKASGTPAQSDQ
jgi:hypothetical protein